MSWAWATVEASAGCNTERTQTSRWPDKAGEPTLELGRDVSEAVTVRQFAGQLRDKVERLKDELKQTGQDMAEHMKQPLSDAADQVKEAAAEASPAVTDAAKDAAGDEQEGRPGGS